MAKLRRASAYRRLERAYTRISKYRKKAYVRTRPHMVIVKFETGNTKRQIDTFKYSVHLLSTKDIQLRHNCLEAARVASNRILEKNLGKSNYHMRIRTFPHHVLRMNSIASGAGADRISEGMTRSFGKLVSTAAQIRKGQIVMEVGVDVNTSLDVAKKALHKAACKLPCTCKIVVNEQKVAAKVAVNEQKVAA